MKSLKIIFVNIFIVLVVIGGISFYTGFEKKANRANAVNVFEGAAAGMESIFSSYMSSEQQLVNSWANSISGKPMTVETAIFFIQRSVLNSKSSVHIVWRDDYSQGISTQPHIMNQDDYTVSYSIEKANHAYELSPAKVLQNLDFSSGEIHITPSYTNPITGSKVIAFCALANLVDNGKNREAVLLYILPVNYLGEKWMFGSEYSNIDVAIIEKNGNYVIQPSKMKNTSFYEFIYSYNKISQESIKNLIFDDQDKQTGSFFAKDSRGVENIYAYTIVEGTNNHAVVIGMPSKNLSTHTIDWIIITFTMLALAISLISNTIFFTNVTKKQQEQVEIIRKQRGQLETALSEAQKANIAKTAFLSNMSHDIRTPMNAIIGFTNLAINHLDNEKQAEDYLLKIQASSNHLLSLINDVLDMSRIESGKVEIEERQDDIVTLVQNLRTFVNDTVYEKGLSLEIQVEECVHSKVYCDKLRLNQIFLNLLSNAIKFTNPGGSIKLIARETGYSNAGYANYEFHVKDTGIGMKPDFAKRVFDPFERERNSTVSGIQGTGLGMAITKSLVDMMKGSISVESQVGLGTDFKLELTFKTYEEQIEAKTSSNKNTEKEPEISIDFTGKKILLVEDNELNQEIAAEILKSFGLEVLLANDGIDAINMIKKANPGDIDLIFMDIQMPHMDGYEATKIIRRLEDSSKAKIPILAMTANAFEEDKRNAVSAGMNGHLSKPIDVTELIKELNTYLNSSNLNFK